MHDQVSHVKSANIATAKNQLSRLLKRVQRGETILITDRARPVALLSPVQAADDVVAALIAEGAVLPPRQSPLDVEAFLKMPRPRLAATHSLTQAVLEEREEGR